MPVWTIPYSKCGVFPRNISSATCLRRLSYLWRHLRHRSFVDKTEAFRTRQHASRSLTTFWKHILTMLHRSNMTLFWYPNYPQCPTMSARRRRQEAQASLVRSSPGRTSLKNQIFFSL